MLLNDKSVAVKAAIDGLETWAVSGAPFTNTGICNNLAVIMECKDIYWSFVVGCAAKSWPHYSGNPACPVPSHSCASPREAFEEGGLWEGSYGALRKDLCTHIANYLKEASNTSLRLPCLGEKVWCSIKGIRKEGEVLRVFEDACYNYCFWTSCDEGLCPIDAYAANKEWGFIE